MEKKQESSTTPSVLGGTMIIAATAVGAAVFSLPIISAGMWFSWSVACLLVTWFCMYHSSLMILETNLNFPVGSSFNTMTKGTLGPLWTRINGFAIIFSLYVMIYAFISGAGSSITHSLQAITAIPLSPRLVGLCFALGIFLAVWYGTRIVSKIVTVILAGIGVTLVLSLGHLITRTQPALLFNVDGDQAHYFRFVFAALPLYIAAFGYHGNIPNLMKYYRKDPLAIRKCLSYGTLLILGIYLVWLTSIQGNISRQDFKTVIAQGANLAPLASAMSEAAKTQSVSIALSAFFNMALASSFLGVSLSLLTYIADKLNFDEAGLGRFKAAMITFAPPLAGYLFFPEGYLYAIGFVGFAATIWAVIVPALMVKASREKFGNPLFRVWGGDGLIYTIILFGLVYAGCHLLAMAGLLPIYG